jgi:outer membrane protein assembly factor BamD
VADAGGGVYRDPAPGRDFYILRVFQLDRPAGAPLPKHVPTARPLLLLAVILAAAASSGCKSGSQEFDMAGSPERIHREATRDLENGNYPSAIQKLELLEARFPFSDPAKQGQLDLIYAYYKNREGESAVDQADQFIRENPTHPRVDYAYYIRGLVYFEGGANFLERSFKVDISKRPPQEARKAFQSFQVLVQAYPKSPYAADSRQRMVYLRNRLADYELGVADYYMKRGAYVGALNRARGLIETYDGAPAVPKALELSARAYRKLGIEDLAVLAESVREKNDVPNLVNPTAAMAGLVMADPATGELPDRMRAMRAGRWEVLAGLSANGSSSVDFKGGTRVNVESGTGLKLGVAYHYNDHLQLSTNATFDSKDYSAQIAGDEPGETFPIKGSMDTTALMFDAAYNILTGPLTPYVSAGLGYTWVDTNIATSPPEIGCWWNPWWGYVCTTWQDTKSVNGFAYELGAGVRWDFNDAFSLDGGYVMRWINFDNATSTPSFDAIQVNVGWKF